MKFTESEINFSFKDRDKIWRPEKTSYFQKMTGVNMADFAIETAVEKVFFVEVKKSAPKDLDSYLNDIAEQLKGMIALLTSLVWQRKQNVKEPLPKGWNRVGFLRNKEWRCLLIVKNHQQEWMVGLQEALQIHKEFRRIEQLYQMKPPICMNEESVKKIGWCQ